MEYFKVLFQAKDFNDFRKMYEEAQIDPGVKYFYNLNKLYNFTYLFTNDRMPDEDVFLLPFKKDEKKEAAKYYEWKVNPPYKSPIKAAILSTIIPGLGKIYAEQYSDGITAAIATGVLGYLSYANFHAGHKFRAWLFTALTTGFYAGNIYGSYAAAQIYNVKINFNFVKGVQQFLTNNNYFTPVLNFCK